LLYNWFVTRTIRNQVRNQPGQPGQYHHRYPYDADNRIKDVFTTTNEALIGADGS
jgi:hypothetical protein